MKTIFPVMLFLGLLTFTGCWETSYGPVLVNKTNAAATVELVTSSERLKVMVPAASDSWRRYPLGGKLESVTVTYDGKQPTVIEREKIEEGLALATSLNDVTVLIQTDGVKIISHPRK